MNKIQPDVKSNYAYCPVVFDEEKLKGCSRDIIFDKLKCENIVARKYFYPLINDYDCYKALPTSGSDKTPIARRIANSVLTLPLYADITTEEVDRICDIILS